MSAKRVTATLGLGSNVGERAQHLERALAALGALPESELLRVSSWHETEPVGGPAGQGPYLNGVAELATQLAPRELLRELHLIEASEGRERGAEVRHGPRTLDLDILFYADWRIEEPELQVPHPRLDERLFVLAPLAELDPGRLLPASGCSVRERLETLRRASTSIERLPDPASAARYCAERRAAGARIGFVPTMGALHEGHISLVRRSIEECDCTCVSVFVNPLQFNETDDFAKYPRDLDGDVQLLSEAGCSMVFSGTLRQFFPVEAISDTRVADEHLLDPGPASRGLEGEFRPGHFDGVATIVGRLFDVVEPHRAYFGAKDYQQGLVVRDLARSRGRPDVFLCPISREESGLARSSRNERLSADGRRRASGISRALETTARAWADGERSATQLTDHLRAELERNDIEWEYAELRDPDAWSADAETGELARAIALVAARIEDVRLIDNMRLDQSGA